MMKIQNRILILLLAFLFVFSFISAHAEKRNNEKGTDIDLIHKKEEPEKKNSSGSNNNDQSKNPEKKTTPDIVLEVERQIQSLANEILQGGEHKNWIGKRIIEGDEWIYVSISISFTK